MLTKHDYTSHHSIVTRVCLARSSKREPVKACTKARWQRRFPSLLCVWKRRHLRPGWKPELSCSLVAVVCPRSSKQDVLSRGARQKSAKIRTSFYYVIVTFPLSDNLIGQTPGRLAVPSFSTKDTRPPYEPTKWRPEVGWG